jgi:hypothetical protein
MAHFRTRRLLLRGMCMKKLLLLAAAAAGALAFFKKQRDAELDQAIWEEPRDL